MDSVLQLRKATVRDVPTIAELVNYYAGKGIMLPRPLSKIYDNLRDYWIAEKNGTLVGCGALHIMWSDLGEIRALAIREEHQHQGYGRHIMEKLLEEAKILELEKVFLLTYQCEFFEKSGFAEISKSELPHKIWNECVNCIHFPDCNEIAMMLYLNDRGSGNADEQSKPGKREG